MRLGALDHTSSPDARRRARRWLAGVVILAVAFLLLFAAFPSEAC